MKFFAGFAAITLAVAGYGAQSWSRDEPDALAAAASERLDLRVAGSRGGCLITRSAADAGRLMPASHCSEIHPMLAEVRGLRAEADGSVALVSQKGEPLLRFGAADGPGYESFEPASALLVLTGVDG